MAINKYNFVKMKSDYMKKNDRIVIHIKSRKAH